MVGAAVRKSQPQVPNDKLHRGTDNRLAEVGKVLRITGSKSFKGEGGNFTLDANIDRQPVKLL